ncbi:MAG: uroporphyrinogen-III C-methyltransferase [Phycisphaerae bacterium]|jgi:uroporphyrinogen III methyltransferase/synthase
MKNGIVYLVGAGPGDPGLITVRGLELLKRADVVIYDHLASPRLLRHVRSDAQLIYVGKEAAAHTLNQDQINQALIEHARAGKAVVRLKGGDPFVFGRGGEEALALVEAGLAFEVVPGVTSGIAAPAYAGIPVTHRGMASCFGVVTGHETPQKEGSSLDYAALAHWGGTLAFYMGVANLEPICRGLIDNGLAADTPVALVRWGTTPAQQVLVGVAGDIAEKAREADFRPPAIILVGQVVALREKLNWFERRPLFGQRVVVTRARAQASDLSDQLEQLGAEVIELPTIRIERPEDPLTLTRAVREFGSFDWVIFASANAVEAVLDALTAAELDIRALGPCRICAIGPATADCLAAHGLLADVLPPRFAGEAVVELLASLGQLKGRKVFCPRPDIAPPDLVNALLAGGALVREVVAYRTVPDSSNVSEVTDLLEEGLPFWVTFTSSSTVKNFLAAVSPNMLAGKNVQYASIGPSTSATLREAGLVPTVEAKDHTIPGLVAAILAHSRP